MNNCPTCNTEMLPLLTSYYCPNEDSHRQEITFTIDVGARPHDWGTLVSVPTADGEVYSWWESDVNARLEAEYDKWRQISVMIAAGGLKVEYE